MSLNQGLARRERLEEWRVRWLHLLVGIVGVSGFLGTGQYMDKIHDYTQASRRSLARPKRLRLVGPVQWLTSQPGGVALLLSVSGQW
jgi:hypothetical protein